VGGSFSFLTTAWRKDQPRISASESLLDRYFQDRHQTMDSGITSSTGNVFEDLGFEAEEAENLRVRARLMAPLERYVRERDLTQMEAAKELETTQARISELVNGKVQAFSIDALVNMLSRAGLEVDVHVRSKQKA
jgi:predicted XRE-type DNA-binding protein